MSINVNVLMGGPSAEHEVSLHSGFEVIANLDKSKYSVRAVVINSSGQFFFKDIDAGIPEFKDFKAPENSSCFLGPFSAFNSNRVWDNCDVAFLALHGSYGEDGVIQGFLDAIGIPYTGSGVFASATAMNKVASKYLYIQNGLDVPPYSVYGINFPKVTIDSIIQKHGFPCFVKCPQSGSSRLMGRAGTDQELRSFLNEFEKYSGEILIEKSIEGIEFSCGIIENSNGIETALPPIEIRPVHANFFDYTAKYTTGESQEIVPAPRPEMLLDRIRQTALAAHKILGCSGVSRTDMIYNNDKLFVLETNTLPGLTSNSLLPKAFKAAGGSYQELLDILINSALRKQQAVNS